MDKVVWPEAISKFKRKIMGIESGFKPVNIENESFEDDYRLFKQMVAQICEQEVDFVKGKMALSSAMSKLSRDYKNSYNATIMSHTKDKIESLRGTSSELDSLLSDIETKLFTENERPTKVKRGIQNLLAEGAISEETANLALGIEFWHPVMEFLNGTPQDYAKLRKKAEENLINRHENPPLVPLAKIAAHVRELYENRNSLGWVEIEFCLAIATGRRPTELLTTGTFTRSNTNRYLNFKGQLKKRGESDESYRIPLFLLDANEVLTLKEMLDNTHKVRSLLGKSEKQVNNTTARYHSEFMDELIEELELETDPNREKLVFSSTRSIWAHAVYTVYSAAEFGSVSFAKFQNIYLGHTPDTLKTSLNYQDVVIDWSGFEGAKTFEIRSETAHKEQAKESAEKALTIEALKEVLESDKVEKILGSNDHSGKRLVAYLRKMVRMGYLPSKVYIKREAGVSPQKLAGFSRKLGINLDS